MTGFLEARLDACLPALAANKVRMITNMGAANPAAAAALAAAKGAHVAWIEGDDVRHLLDEDTRLGDIDATIGEVGAPLISANAYLGAEQILPAIETGADIIITGRVADPALFLSPVIHAFGWALDDWPRLGAGTLAGHLLECAGQVTGGYFFRPASHDRARARCRRHGRPRFPPFADIAPDGSFVIAKRPEDGGAVASAHGERADSSTKSMIRRVISPRMSRRTSPARGLEGTRARSGAGLGRKRNRAPPDAEGHGGIRRRAGGGKPVFPMRGSGRRPRPARRRHPAAAPARYHRSAH